MKSFIHRYATPLTTGLFAVSTISGVALFFHWQGGWFHSMHEWLSMVLLLPFAFHVWKNWNSLVGYLRRRTLLIPLLLSVVVAVPFAMSSGNGGGKRGGNPAFRAAGLLTQAPLSALAPVLKTTPDALLATLRDRGYSVDSADMTLASVASTAGKEPMAVLGEVMPKGGDRPPR
ncbi:DUF4405 domain-containing protein [Solimonas marina]|uniref:DUF4405 domain-containing protein n=1 Tax=Solimonas marina TaxID=2714601 RepID=A0A970B748_9GAMM|nr:DUF4405 domain-containing protein [Solimonas marina]NKF23285.1 DUF4405 domain-containing protein [Solimonas marina]